VPTLFEKPFLDSHRFRYVRNSKNRHVVMDENNIILPPIENPVNNKEYRSVWGPLFVNDFYPLKADDRGLFGCVRRLTAVRKPEVHNLHNELVVNQYNFIRNNPLLEQAVAILKNRYRYILSQYDREELLQEWYDTPMPKKKLRKIARNQIEHNMVDNTYVTVIDYKCKKGEFLKRDKYLRGIGDLTTPGSVRAAFMIPPLKKCMQDVIIDGDNRLDFVKDSSNESLVKCFQLLWQNNRGIVMQQFSDDSCVSVFLDKLYVYNMDISSCDGSNYDPVFSVLYDIMSVDDRFYFDVNGVFKQLKKDLVLKFSDFKIRMKSDFYKLPSGSSLTTMINNIANLFIFVSLLNNRLLINADNISDVIEASAASAGFIVKLQLCEVPEDTQFLKHSPYFDEEGVCHPFLNLGVPLRSFGSCVGDLPGKFSKSIFETRNSEIARSYKHAGNCSFYNVFRDRFVINNRKIFSDIEERGGADTYYIPDEALLRRYKITQAELDELLDVILHSEMGHAYSCRGIDAVISVDYG